MKTLSDPQKQQQRAFALIVTVILLSLLAIMAVAFLSTSRVERGTASAVTSKAKADLIAQTAVNAAVASLVDNLTNQPDSATSWEQVNQTGGTNLQYQGTMLYYRDQTPEATAAGTPSPLHVIPLISGAQAAQVWPSNGATADDIKRTALPALDSNNSFDLNRARFSGDTQGAIGAPLGAATRPEFRGQWISLTDSNTKVTGRYAYWMEDESFKVNANLMGNTPRGSTTLGATPTEIPLQGFIKTSFTSADPIQVANAIYGFRGQFPNAKFFEYRALNQVSPQLSIADSAKFEATIYSGSLDTSRSGSKRVNLNKIVSTSTSASEIRTQLDEIIKPITTQLPNFGERFYRTDSTKPNGLQVPATDKTIYLNKIAANVRDYIDTDPQPTIVNNDGSYSVRVGPLAPTDGALSAQNSGNAGPNEIIALGKESVPLLEEYALRIRLTKFTPAGFVPDNTKPDLGNPGADYEFYLDFYFEFWNMTNKDIAASDLGPNPYLKIANQPGWDTLGGPRTTQAYLMPTVGIPSDPKRDIKIPLASIPNLVFKAGAATVITTDPNSFPTLVPNSGSVFLAPTLQAGTISAQPAGSTTDDFRRYAGKTFKFAKSNPVGFPNSAYALRVALIPRSSSTTDYETEAILANDNGYLESFEGVSISQNISIDNDSANRIDSQVYFPRGGRLRSNNGITPGSHTGDPRTNNEQLTIAIYNPGLNGDQTRWIDSGLNNNSVPSTSSLTELNSAPTGNFSDFSIWPDSFPNPTSPYTGDIDHAPVIVANAAMKSIGELGHIFDPVRVKNSSNGSNDIHYSRGGGCSLKIGQPDRSDASTNPYGLWDGDSNAASREWTAWRLTDIFSISDAVQLDGRINVNGVNRDDGLGLKTALYGYAFQPKPDSDPLFAGSAFDSDPNDTNDKVNEFVRQLKARLKNDPTSYNNAFSKTSGPLAERGELSELPIFNTGKDLVSTVDTKTAFDRGREELFRRIVELITTRGNIFTVYAVGQALIPQANPATAPVVAATSQMKVTFRIDPVWTAGMPSDPYDATSTARFAKPDKYAIKILYAGE